MTPTLNNIKNAAPNIDIAYAYYNQSDNQTIFGARDCENEHDDPQPAATV